MNKKMICIACPRGCAMTVNLEGDEPVIRGNQCSRGLDYARQEILQPLRMLTTTVKTTHPDYPRLPVRLSCDIPKDSLLECMRLINRVRVDHDCLPGDVLVSGVAGELVNLIATGDLSYDA
ncbi:MAG: DUF1667 domain-containing protein [Spirochaetales bacterium]|nr:DUF1667 domain-containing protein [Spirochaetales bacterium]